MVHFIRDHTNATIAEIEAYVKTREDGSKFVEAYGSIDLERWYKTMKRIPEEKWDQLAYDFELINDYRGFLWESHYMIKKNDGSDMEEVDNNIRTLMHDIINSYDYDFIYVTD